MVAYTSVGFCVAVQRAQAMREASIGGTVTDTDSCAFLLFIALFRGDYGAQILFIVYGIYFLWQPGA